MALPVITDTIRATCSGLVEGGVGWSNTYHFKKDPTDTYANAMTQIAAQLATLHAQTGYGAGKYGWAQYNTDGSIFNAVTLTPLDGSTASKTFNYSVTGVSTQNALPGQTAMAITLATANRGRSYRGRVFWSCTSREVIDGSGHVAQADTAGTDLAFSAFIAALGALTKPVQLVVASYLHGTTTPVVNSVARQVLAHQTHRRGRGA